MSLGLLLYNLLFPVVLLLMLPGLLLRLIRRGNYQHKFSQRFARYDADVLARIGSGRTWIHSISVGETFVAIKLARQMKQADSSLKFVLSVTTSTGFAQAQSAASDWLEVIYNPIDALPFVKRALDAIAPARLIFIEAMWPNLLTQAKKRGVPVAMIPRLSPRSEARFLKARSLVAPVFKQVDLWCVQDKSDLERWTRLGADPSKIQVTGAIKFDYAQQPADTERKIAALGAIVAELTRASSRQLPPVLLAGSTFPGEEKLFTQVFLGLRKQFPELFLILVPRHVERTAEVLNDLQPFVTGHGLRVAVRTQLAAAPKPADCLVVNTTGELAHWYHLATAVVIGKSFLAEGGQNPAEPVVAGKPVLFGPHMENFSSLVGMLLESGGATQVSDAAALEAELRELLGQPGRSRDMAQRARLALQAHTGATARVAACCQALCSRR